MTECLSSWLMRLGVAAFDQLATNLPQQFRRPHGQLLAAFAIQFLGRLIVAKQQLPRIKHALDEDFPPEALLHDDGHLIAHRVPGALRIAKERESLLVDLVLAYEFLLNNVEKELLQGSYILVEIGQVAEPARAFLRRAGGMRIGIRIAGRSQHGEALAEGA